MAKDYSDIPCVKLGNIIHITKSGSQCICGTEWKCGFWNTDRPEAKQNIIWRSLNAVICSECKKIYETK